MKERDGNILTSDESVLRGWKEQLEELMNKENVRERRMDGEMIVNPRIQRIRNEKVTASMNRTGSRQFSRKE